MPTLKDVLLLLRGRCESSRGCTILPTLKDVLLLLRLVSALEVERALMRSAMK